MSFTLARVNRSAQLNQVRSFYAALLEAWGPQNWWPAEGPLEVVVGAYLTQNTSWKNVERAIANLRSAGALNLNSLRAVPLQRLEELVRPAGYFRQKAERLKIFIAYLDRRYGGSLERMFGQPTGALRDELLALKGVGPETADSILLYAGNHPVFVVDAYTRRMVDRHGILPATAPYEEVRVLFEDALKGTIKVRLVPLHARGGSAHEPSKMSLVPRTELTQRFNEMHAVMVGVGKNYCLKAVPECDQCPLQRFLPRGTQRTAVSELPRHG